MTELGCKPGNCSNPECTNSEGIIFFRGSWDPLSPFYRDDIVIKGKRFKTAEHAYHHEKVIHISWKRDCGT